MEVRLLDAPIYLCSIPALFIASLALAAYLFHCSRRISWRAEWPARVSSRHYPFYGSLDFWAERSTFFKREGSDKNDKPFGFFVGSNPVVGLTGTAGRAALLHNPKLDLGEGQTFLFGGTPLPESENNIMKGATFLGWFVKTLRTLLKSDYLDSRLPVLRDDINTRLNTFAEATPTILDPFDDMYKLVFQLNMRTVGADEIACDWDRTIQVVQWYKEFAQNFGPLDPIAPWLPTYSKMKRLYLATRLYRNLKSVIMDRINRVSRHDDAVQRLVDAKTELDDIVGFVIAGLGGGQSNTGYNVAFLIYALSVNRDWQDKLVEEIRQVARRHAHDQSAALIDQLACLPVSAWETGFPLLMMCLNESIRHTLMGSAIRKNISSKDLILENGAVIPAHGFAVCQYAEAHVDPDIYTMPSLWDPGRFGKDRAEHKKQPAAFVGWGYGRHPCAGERFARLEVAAIVAHFLARFQPSACDAKGNALMDPTVPPMQPDAYACKGPQSQVFIRLEERSF